MRFALNPVSEQEDKSYFLTKIMRMETATRPHYLWLLELGYDFRRAKSSAEKTQGNCVKIFCGNTYMYGLLVSAPADQLHEWFKDQEKPQRKLFTQFYHLTSEVPFTEEEVCQIALKFSDYRLVMVDEQNVLLEIPRAAKFSKEEIAERLTNLQMQLSYSFIENANQWKR